MLQAAVEKDKVLHVYRCHYGGSQGETAWGHARPHLSFKELSVFHLYFMPCDTKTLHSSCKSQSPPSNPLDSTANGSGIVNLKLKVKKQMGREGQQNRICPVCCPEHQLGPTTGHNGETGAALGTAEEESNIHKHGSIGNWAA